MAEIAAIATVLIGVSGCSALGFQQETTTTHVSRVTIYDSLKSMAVDSTDVIVGTVIDERTVADLNPQTPYTIAGISVVEVAKSTSGIAIDDRVEVRQLGGEGLIGPVPHVEKGETYLFYLAQSGLDGDLAAQFYVRGIAAGIYRWSETNAQGEEDPLFEQFYRDEADQLPQTIRLSEALG